MIPHGSRRDRTLVAARPPVVGEFAIGLATFALYVLVESLAGPGREAAAQQHGRDLLALERALRIPAEEWFNAWLAPHNLLRVVANYEYAVTYIATALWLLVWLYRKRPATYRWARSSFLLLNAIAVACFALYPVAPPRLLVGGPFIDTVTADHTWGSWGSPMVSRANQLAAMPSLHIAWALWVSVVLACVSGRLWVQVLSGLHVTITTLVIMATANHYLLDAVAGALLVWVSMVLMSLVRDRPGRAVGARLAGADAFFLYVESPAAPQHVGGVIILDGPAAGFRDRLRSTVEAHLDGLPRFRQRLAQVSRWRRPRWVPAPDLDWDWHVPAYELDGGGQAALHRLVAQLQETPLPRDRPLWRFLAVTGFVPGKVAAVLIVHHSVSDGIGTIAQAVTMLEPVPSLVPSAPGAGLGPVRRAAATVAGIAQLATDGPSRHRLPAAEGPGRRYVTLAVPLRRLRSTAHAYGVRVTDVLLSLVAGALRRVVAPADVPPELRTAVPLMMRVPESAAEGNVTAAVMIDLPMTPMAEADRLRETGRRAARLRSGTRVLGARFVMHTGCAVLPPPVLAWFARTVYGRRFFQAVVSNMPGPQGRYRLAGATFEQVYPILPLAPGAPVAVGAIGWDGTVFVGVSVAETLVDDADRFAAALRETLAALTAERPDRPAAEFVSRLVTGARLEPDRAALVAPEPLDGVEVALPDTDSRLHARANISRARPSGESNVEPNSS